MFRTIDKLDVKGKRVLVRADLNVPAKDGKVTDTTRIDRSAATLIQPLMGGPTKKLPPGSTANRSNAFRTASEFSVRMWIES